MSRVLDLFNVICTYKYHRWKNQQKVFYATFVLKIPFTSLWFLESDFFNNYFETAYVLYVPSFIWVNARQNQNKCQTTVFFNQRIYFLRLTGQKKWLKTWIYFPPPPSCAFQYTEFTTIQIRNISFNWAIWWISHSAPWFLV